MQGVVEALGFHVGSELHARAINRDSNSSYIDQILTEIKTPASLEVAKNHRDLHSLRKWDKGRPREFSYWCSSTVHFAKYSLGFLLHFMMVKQLILVFFFIAGTSVLQLYLNYTGNYFRTPETQSSLDFFSIANQYGLRLNSTEILDTNKIDNNYFMIWVADGSCSAFFLICVLVFFIYAYVRIKKELKNTYRISDYAVEIKGLPRKGVTKEEVFEHFSRIGEVVEVYIGRRYENVLRFYTEKAKITEEIVLRESLLAFKQKDIETDKKLVKLKAKRLKFDMKIKKSESIHKHEELEVKRAYVVFNSKQDKICCLKVYNRKNCCGCTIQRKKYRFRQQYKLQVVQCPEPSDIIWENLEIGKCSRFMRFLLSILVTLFLLLCSVGMIYYVKTAQSNIPSEETCALYDVAAPGSSKSDTQTLCYCKNLSENELIHESYQSCYIYIEYISYAWSMKFLSSFGIILINFLLKTIMRRLSSFERPKSKSEIQSKSFKKIFLVMFINTAILTYLVNLSIPSFTKYILSGKYSDFTRDWFLSVGSLLLILMIISMGSPHLIFLAIAYPLAACKRRCCWRRKKSQYELNSMFTGPEFDIAARTAQIFSVVFTSYLYSGGIPLLNCTCFLYLIIIYYTDKFLVLRHHRRPPSYNQDLYLSALKILPLAVVLHSIFSLWVYGNSDFFRIDYKEYQNLHQILGDQIASRIEKPSGLCNVILILSALCLILLLNFLDMVCSCCIKRLWQFSENERKFKEIKDEISRSALDSYDIRRNPDYALIINEMDETCILHENQEHKGYFETTLRGKQSTSRNETLLIQQSVSHDNIVEDHKDEKESSEREEISASSDSLDLSRDENRKVELNLSGMIVRKTSEDEQLSFKEDYEKSKQESESDEAGSGSI